jgi:PAS domain S-box-containing protein
MSRGFESDTLFASSAGNSRAEALMRAIFPGNSEMASRMRRFDWAASDFGPVERWPEHLRIALRLCLTSRFPILLWWGPKLCILYNDAYLPWLTEAKHPRALGGPGYDCWSEIWDIIGPMLKSVLSTGQATWSVDTELFFDRKVRKEEVYITWTFAPILAADGRTVDGIFTPCVETTEKVIGARRLETLRKLGIRSGEGRTVEAACKEAAAVLSENTRDIPFAAIYVMNETGNEAKRCATMLPNGEDMLPLSIRTSEAHESSSWPLASVLQTKQAAECADLDALGIRLSSGPWPEATRQALVLPIHAVQEQLDVFVVGVSSRRPLDAEYRTFFDLVASHIGTAIADARAYEGEKKRAEALAELDRAKTAFFNNVSHEFRTPLTLMLGPIEDILARGDGSLMIGRDEVELMHRNSLRLLKLVNTLLDFSRIEAGRIEAVYAAIDLATYTAELASVFRSAIEKAGLKLTVDCPALPEPVFVDREMWEKIVLNLLSNAYKFTLDGEIKVSLRWQHDGVELIVADTGVGIRNPELPHIFERFHRVHDVRSRTHEGTGIGLSLVQELVKLHRGSVTVESKVGRGTAFSVSIPAGAAHLPKDRVGAARTAASTSMGARPFVEEALRWLPTQTDEATRMEDKAENQISGSQSELESPKSKILIADDNADMRQYVEHLLAPSCTVTAVADGVTALEAARRETPDLILADVMMPNLDGFGLLREVRDDPSLTDVPVVLLSARAGEEARIEGMQAGADDYLIKPFTARELLSRVAARLEIARMHREALEQERKLRKLAEEGEDLIHLHELSGRLVTTVGLQPLLEEILDAMVKIVHADFGKVLLYDPKSGALRIAAQRGFRQEFLDYFNVVREGTLASGLALQRRERVIVEDVTLEPLFAPHLEIVAAAGFRAVQSTPLVSRSGEPLGVISTHSRQPHRPSERELRLVDLYARQAAEMIEHKRAEEERRSNETYLAEAEKLSHTASWAWNVCTGEIYWSLEHYRICGVAPEAFTPTIENARELIHPDDLSSTYEALEKALRERSDFKYDLRISRPDGTIRFVQSLAHPVFNESGDLIEYVGTIIDRTEQYETRATLEQAFEEIKTLKERLYHENVALREEIDRTAMFEEIVGTSRAVRVVVSRIAKVAPTDSTVLVTGESGTGKELIARAIHKRSKRAGQPFIAFNCAGIPSTLIASELFGYEKGAFTGAQQRRLGRFELAEGGTIFLDEVGDLPVETQIALLRVLQEREFERVGGMQPIATDVRVIAASNQDLEDAIAAGTFRLDLFHRLNVFPIEVPPLRERSEDIPLLMEYFIKRYAAKSGKAIKSVDKKTTQLFKSYSWPGNIRELQNVIERSVILCESDIFSVDESWLSKTALQPPRVLSTLADSLIEQEKKIIEAALAESRGRIAGRLGAASKLGIPSSTLESKIKTLKIKKSRFKPD